MTDSSIHDFPHAVKGVIYGCGATALGGTMAVATRYVIGETDPLSLAMLRYGFALLALLPFAIYAGHWRMERRDLRVMLMLGAMFFAFFPAGFSWALVYTTASRGALMLAMMPMGTLLLGVLLGRERITLFKVIGVFLVIAGVAVVTGDSGSDDIAPEAWKGDLIMLAMAALGAIFNTLIGPYARKYPRIQVTVFTMGAGWLLLAVAYLSVLPGGTLMPELSTEGWIAIVYLATLGGAAPIFLFNLALAYAPPTEVTITIGLNPLTAVFLASFILGEPLTWGLLIGLFLVVGGIITASGLIGPRRRSPPPSPL